MRDAVSPSDQRRQRETVDLTKRLREVRDGERSPAGDGMIDGYWLTSHKADPRAVALHSRHYSARRYADGRQRRQFMPPGETMVLLTADCRAVFGWQRARVERFDHQQGVCCTLFRNEGSILSSQLVAEADELAWARWPDEQRHFTYVDPAAVASANPGYCFLMAGWRRCGVSKSGLLLLERADAGGRERPGRRGPTTRQETGT